MSESLLKYEARQNVDLSNLMARKFRDIRDDAAHHQYVELCVVRLDDLDDVKWSHIKVLSPVIFTDSDEQDKMINAKLLTQIAAIFVHSRELDKHDIVGDYSVLLVLDKAKRKFARVGTLHCNIQNSDFGTRRFTNQLKSLYDEFLTEMKTASSWSPGITKSAYDRMTVSIGKHVFSVIDTRKKTFFEKLVGFFKKG